MNVKQYSILKEYEPQMTTAKNSNYVRALGSQSREKLAVVYKEIFNRDSGFPSGCGSCILKNLKELATIVPNAWTQNLPDTTANATSCFAVVRAVSPPIRTKSEKSL